MKKLGFFKKYILSASYKEKKKKLVMHPFSPSHFNQYGKYAKNVFLCFIFSVYSERQMNTASHRFRVSVFVVLDQFVFIFRGRGV